MNYKIRPAEIEDVSDLARVRVETWRSAYRGLIPDEVLDGMDMEKEIQRWRENLTGDWPAGRFLFVAQIEMPGELVAGSTRNVVGFCTGGANRDANPEYEGEIYAIYILPAFQGLGIGRALLNAAQNSLREQGWRGMIIWVLRDNLPSRRFYEAMGGQLARERMIDIRGNLLPEVGYGYQIVDRA